MESNRPFDLQLSLVEDFCSLTNTTSNSPPSSDVGLKKEIQRVRTPILKCVPIWLLRRATRRKYISVAILPAIYTVTHNPQQQNSLTHIVLLEQIYQEDYMKYRCLFAILMSLLSKQSTNSLKIGRPRSLLSRLAVPIGLVVLNTFMMSTSTEGSNRISLTNWSA